MTDHLLNAAGVIAVAAAVCVAGRLTTRWWQRPAPAPAAAAGPVWRIAPCPDCRDESHDPAGCTCPADCGHLNCTGPTTGDFAAWEAEYARHQLRSQP
jgi:hypothetical protein